MSRILLLATGGTIASVPSGNGLRPETDGAGLLSRLGAAAGRYEVTSVDLMKLDSSDLQPEDWQALAREIFSRRESFDGVVVTHGTDTMAYTASMLSFMLPSIGLPVVLTGSQLPMGHPLTDAPANLRLALEMAASGCPGVFVAFGNLVLRGCRAAKHSTEAFDGFRSVNLPPVAVADASGLRIAPALVRRPDGPARLEDRFESRVALVKLFPGLEPRLLAALPGLGMRGAVVEAFGSGGVPTRIRNLTEALKSLAKSGLVVAVGSQCPDGKADLSIYEAGQRVQNDGIVCLGEMSVESAVTKLMWALGQTASRDEAAALFAEDLAGELIP